MTSLDTPRPSMLFVFLQTVLPEPFHVSPSFSLALLVPNSTNSVQPLISLFSLRAILSFCRR